MDDKPLGKVSLSMPWLDGVAFLAFWYILFHMTPIIAFLDRLIGAS